MTGLIVKGLLILAALAALSYGVHVVLEHFREQGRVEQRAIDDPIIAKLKANLATSQANEDKLLQRIADSNRYIEDLQTQASNAKARAQQALAAADAQAKAAASTIADLMTKVNAAPTVDYAAACKETEALVDRLLAGSAP